jgi:hypothetical protein
VAVGGACDVGGAVAVGDMEIWDGDVYEEQSGGGWGRGTGASWGRVSCSRPSWSESDPAGGSAQLRRGGTGLVTGDML